QLEPDRPGIDERRVGDHFLAWIEEDGGALDRFRVAANLDVVARFGLRMGANVGVEHFDALLVASVRIDAVDDGAGVAQGDVRAEDRLGFLFLLFLDGQKLPVPKTRFRVVAEVNSRLNGDDALDPKLPDEQQPRVVYELERSRGEDR